MYRLQDNRWIRLGGTITPAGSSTAPSTSLVSVSIPNAGPYRVLEDPDPTGGNAQISGVTVTPRVLSLQSNDIVRIGFDLGRSGVARIGIYNRAGRPVRTDLSQNLRAGSNLVRWDGKDEAGRPVLEGIYLLCIEAQGKTRSIPIAVTP